MKQSMTPVTNVDEYIASFPDEVQTQLNRVRATIAQAASSAEEAIKYGLPTFVGSENLVHFGAFKKHIGFYPTPSGIVAFESELSVYTCSKGAVQFPLKLIAKIVKFRVREATMRAKSKKQAKH